MGCRLAVRADANNNRTTPSSLLSREAQPHLIPVSQGQGGLVSQLGLVPVQQSPGEAAAVSSQGRKQRGQDKVGVSYAKAGHRHSCKKAWAKEADRQQRE